MDNDRPPEGEPPNLGYDAPLPDLEDPMPDISFDFQTRGDDQDTTINDSQDVALGAGAFGALEDEVSEERALQALLLANEVDTDAAAPGEQEEQLPAPVAPMAVMDASDTPEAKDNDILENSVVSPEDALQRSLRAAELGTKFVVRFPSLSDEYRNQYTRIESDIVETVKGEDITEAGSLFYTVEFTDGREDLVSPIQFLSPEVKSVAIGTKEI